MRPGNGLRDRRGLYMWRGKGLQRAGPRGFADRKSRRVIVSATCRTDIPAFYAIWLIARRGEPGHRLVDRGETE